MASNQISEQNKKQLQTCHLKLNPFILKQKIERKLKGIFKLVKVTNNVRQRILYQKSLRLPFTMRQREREWIAGYEN